MLRFGALEADGTKVVCAVGTPQGKILERISIPTRSPEAAIKLAMDAYVKKGGQL